MTFPLVHHLKIQCPWLSDDAARTMLEDVAAAITSTLLSGDPVKIPGLGKLQVVEAKPRKGRNPRNPTVEILIPAKKRIKFTAAKGLIV